MDRAQKEKVVEELGQIFESSGVVVVAHYAGLTVADMQDLRARARAAEASVRVAKNRLAKIALEGKPCESMTQYLTGMTVLTFSEDPVAAAKVAEDFAKSNAKFEILAVQWVKTHWIVLALKRYQKCHLAKSLLRLSWVALAHLLRTSLAQLAHLQATSQAFFRPSKRKLHKQFDYLRWIYPIVGTQPLVTERV